VVAEAVHIVQKRMALTGALAVEQEIKLVTALRDLVTLAATHHQKEMMEAKV